ncbi:sugar ABC transporter permease [Paenibacillus sp. 7124]|uniref:Sugar ABC transporter permease n=1 Tax=Paenibacillus apii TaxID=1850370 RepID=A0A6M1PR86_9BACL|nr:sugar ABC transporter permease [Paenibacillus apii]NGM84635.1 sugar ABC transporter permease [Paenibacillus apii]
MDKSEHRNPVVIQKEGLSMRGQALFRPAAASVSNSKKMISESKFAFLLLLPTIVILLGLLLYPFLYSIYLCFVDLNLTKPWVGPKFVGLDNFSAVLKDGEFWLSMETTLYFAVFSVAASMILGLAAALLFNIKFRMRGLGRSLLLIPWAMPGVVNAMIWQTMLHPNYGLLNGVLLKLGVIDSPVGWLSDPKLALASIIMAQVWTSFPFVALMYLAALQSISGELIEAAKIDGAGSVRIFKDIVVKLLVPVTLVLLVLRTIDSFRVFDLVFAMTKGGPANSTQLSGLYLYKQGFMFSDFGLGSAGSYILTGFILVFVLLYMRILRQKDGV